MTKVGILGSGEVGKSLAAGFLKYGYAVMIGSRDPKKQEALKKETSAQSGSFEETAAFGEILVLSAKGNAAVDILSSIGEAKFSGKIIIDTTNPIADAPPVNGVLHFFTTLENSLMEQLQEQFPSAKFVKAFNIVGNDLMVNPDFGGIKPTMFICGNDAAAKQEVTAILDRFGWETDDMGMVQAARAIEPLSILWCIPGFLRNDWSHAFKMLKK
jgi:predicted dinucleotide-binding enzyme